MTENPNEHLRRLMKTHIELLDKYNSLLRVVLDWRNGKITAPLAMEQIVYIAIEIDNDDTAD